MADQQTETDHTRRVHFVDAYGDLIASEWFETEEGRVDAYGDPEPEEQFEEDCELGDDGACVVCGARS